MPHCCSRGICGAAVPFVQPSPDSTFRFFGGKLGVVRHSSWSYHALVTFVRHSYGIRLLALHFGSAYFWANMAAPTRNSTNATRMPYECHTNATRMPHDNFVTVFFGEPHEKIRGALISRHARQFFSEHGGGPPDLPRAPGEGRECFDEYIRIEANS